MHFWRVFSPSLDPQRQYYALINEICGGPTKKFANSLFPAKFPDEILEIKFDLVSEENGRQSSANHFDGGRTKDGIYVSTAFGIIGGLLRGKDLKQFDVLEGKFSQILSTIKFNRPDGLLWTRTEKF